MPIYNAATSMINAFQRGLAERRSEEDRVTEAEDRKLQQDLLKHRLAQMKLEERLAAYNFNVQAAKNRAASLTGRSEADLQTVMPRALPATGIGGIATPAAPPAGSPLQESLGPMMQGPTPPPFAIAAVPNTIAPVPARTIPMPGFVDAASEYNAPAYDIPIMSEEQLIAKQTEAAMRAAEIKAKTEGVTLGSGQRHFVGGKLTAEGGVDPSDAETVRANKAREAVDLMREKRLAREAKDYVTATIAQKAADDLYTNLRAIEADFAPDPKAMALYENLVSDWETGNDEYRKANREPRPPRYRMTQAQLDAAKLMAINSYRAQMHLPAALTLPPEFRNKSAEAPSPDGGTASMTGTAAPPVVAAPVAPSAMPIYVDTPRGPVSFTDPNKASEWASKWGFTPRASAAAATTPQAPFERGRGRELLGVLSAGADALTSGVWDSKTGKFRKPKTSEKKK